MNNNYMQNDLIALGTKEQYRRQAEQIFETLDVSEGSRQDYKYRVGHFVDFVVDNGLDRNTFLEFKRSLAARNDISVNTKNKFLITAKIFLKELNRLGRLPADITQNIKCFTQSRKHLRDGLNDEEMALAVGRLQQLTPTPKNTRLKAIFCLLCLNGLRQLEVVRLDVADLDLANGTAYIQGKGRDHREKIYLHLETVKNLREYLRVSKIADGPLFTSLSNRSRNCRLATRAIRKIIKDLFNGLGITKSTHSTRHFFVTKLVQTYKGDLLMVAQYSRHRSIEQLQVYSDNIKTKADLPRFYSAFKNVSFSDAT